MDLTHRFRVPASVDETWTAFNHLDRVAPCFPGATIARSSGDHFEGSVKIKIGPLALVYNGSGRFLERAAATRRLVFQASGSDRRGNGTATAKVTVSLSGDESATEVEVRSDLDLTGRPAQFGSEVVSDVADKLLAQFVSCVSGRFAEGIGMPGAEDLGTPSSVATEDELWEEWATTEEVDEERDPSDIEQTVEMAAVRSAEDGSDLVTDEAWLAEDDTAPVEDGSVVEEEVVEPTPTPTAPPPPWRYSRPSDLSQPAGSAVANVVTTVLRRYGPLLGLLSLVLVIVIRLINRRRR
jgi:carbon monoxide dehydrogenase subunit G